ncbi:hypothetical protein BDF22DRAFT_401126 [Syncephalis plumigaleata]|nr:hypothetical protein BDF22DRAFT_401126 [Syncephalis plumigaleata]
MIRFRFPDEDSSQNRPPKRRLTQTQPDNESYIEAGNNSNNEDNIADADMNTTLQIANEEPTATPMSSLHFAFPDSPHKIPRTEPDISSTPIEVPIDQPSATPNDTDDGQVPWHSPAFWKNGSPSRAGGRTTTLMSNEIITSQNTTTNRASRTAKELRDAFAEVVLPSTLDNDSITISSSSSSSNYVSKPLKTVDELFEDIRIPEPELLEPVEQEQQQQQVVNRGGIRFNLFGQGNPQQSCSYGTGVEISPRKGKMPYERGGRAELLTRLITNERTEYALWQHALVRQSTNERPTPDMEVMIVQMLQTRPGLALCQCVAPSLDVERAILDSALMTNNYRMSSHEQQQQQQQQQEKRIETTCTFYVLLSDPMASRAGPIRNTLDALIPDTKLGLHRPWLTLSNGHDNMSDIDKDKRALLATVHNSIILVCTRFQSM